MSTTFLGRLDGAEGRDLRLYLTIDGIGDVFQEAATDIPSTLEASTRTRRRVIQTIEQGQAELDLDRRRMVGGSLRVVLLDDFNETLGDLFASRSRRTTYVTATTSTTATTISVSSTATLPSAGTVYVGGETITYTGKTTSPDTLTGCTRGAFGSTAQRHVGGADQGAGVYVSPPRWVGRRVRLWGYFLDDDGTTTTALRSKLDTFRLESAPVYLGHGRWELRCSHLSDEIGKRKIGAGLRELKALPTPGTVSGSYVVWQLEGQGNQFPASTSGFYPSFAAVTFQDKDGIALLRFRTAVDTSYRTEVATDLDGDLGTIHRLPRGAMPETVRHWVVLKDRSAGSLALYALTSILGDAANGTYDVLPGTERDTGVGGDEMRFGAGIPVSEVDTAAFLSVGANAIAGWSYVIDQTIDVVDFLADFCLATESFWLVDADGLLTVRSLSETRTTPLLTVDDDLVIGEPTVELAEDAIYPRAMIRAGYDPAKGDFVDSITVVDVEMANRYPERGDALELETRGFCLSENSIARGIVSRAQLEAIVRRAMVDDGRGRLYVTAKCILPALQLDLGDIVYITLALPDYEGGNISTRTARIVARRPDYDAGVVDLRLQVLETLSHIAPAAVITSVITTTINLDTTAPSNPSGVPTLPSYQFAVNDVIELVNVTTGAMEERIVSSVPTGSSVVVTVAPTITAAGNYIRIAKSTSNTGANTALSGYRSTEYIYQQPATTNGLVTRWR